MAGDFRARPRSVAALADPSLATRARAIARATLRAQGVPTPDAFALGRQVARIHERLSAVATAREAKDRVERFRLTATPEVVRLAAALVRVPLRLDIMRLVQRAIAPDTGPLELAEILGSGLFWPVPDRSSSESSVWFEVVPGARARLVELAPASDGVHVLELVGRYIRDHLGGGYDFEALVVDPGLDVEPVPEELRPFARLYIDELERLGGRHRELARRLAQASADDRPDPPAVSPVLDRGREGRRRIDPAARPDTNDRTLRPGKTPTRGRERASPTTPGQETELRAERYTDFGLVIGIEHYPSFRSLHGAVGDARRFHEWLCSSDGGSVVPAGHGPCSADRWPF